MSQRVAAAVERMNTDASGLAWALFICKACGLIYNEAIGDVDSGLVAGTRFADIPDDWACPLCGVTKFDFEPYVHEEVRTTSARRPVQAPRARHEVGTVIVGAGRAGWQMAQSLRARDANMAITLVTACNGDVYDKPMLSVAMARGVKADQLTRETGLAAATRLGIRLMANTDAVRILPASRQLRTSRGVLRYENLVLAHGAQARSLPQFPATLCWRINHLQAYSKFTSALGTTPQRIAIAGAGLIGSELANDLALAGHKVTLLDVQNRPMASCLSEVQSQQLIEAWDALPIQFMGSVEVSHVQASPDEASAKQVNLQNGFVFTVDHVVVAAGLHTPNRLARSAGLDWNNGIAVESATLATSVQGIHALGDCISINGQVSRFIEPIARQAQTIVANLVGAEAVAYSHRRVPLRVKTTSLPFTL